MKKILTIAMFLASCVPASAGLFSTNPNFYWGVYEGRVALFSKNADPLVFESGGSDAAASDDGAAASDDGAPAGGSDDGAPGGGSDDGAPGDSSEN